MSLTKVIALILLVLLFWFSEKEIRKKLKIPRRKGWRTQHIKEIDKWGERLLFFCFLVSIFISSFSSNEIILSYLLFIFCLSFVLYFIALSRGWSGSIIANQRNM